MRRKTQNEAMTSIMSHKDIHNFYVGGYYQVKPKNRTIHKVTLECKVCGTKKEQNCFEPPLHLKCPECRKKELKEAKRLRKLYMEEEAKEEFELNLIEAIIKYDDFYDYSKFHPHKQSDRGIIICPKHGEFKQNLYTHLTYFGCRDCLLEKLNLPHKKNNKQMVDMLNYIHKGSLDFSNFIATKAAEDSVVKCTTCHHVFPADFNHLSSTSLTGCPSCNNKRGGEKTRLTQKQAINNLNNKFKGSLDFSNFIYYTAKIPSEVYCPSCDKTFERTYDQLIGDSVITGCGYCKGMYKTQEEAIEILKKEADPKLDFSEFIYTGTTNKSWVTCTSCGHRWEASYTLLTRGRSCGNCSQSTGEKELEKVLKSMNIIYEKQKTYSDCTYRSTLRFDVFLPDYDLLIEYHGEQHYEFVDFFHRTWDGFLEQQKKDKIKKEYAEKHHNFLEIPYWDFDKIPEILEQKLKELEGERK